MKNNNSLFYVCSLVEYIAREVRQERGALASELGKDFLLRLYKDADVLLQVYTSWISAVISNYNSDFFYQSREYTFECWKAGEVL